MKPAETTLSEREVVRALLEQLKPFSKPRAHIFYTDLLLTGLIAWTTLFCIQLSIPLIFKFLLGLASYLAFYRGLAFIHETVHFHKKVKGLRTLYNFIFGFPGRIPFFIHDPHRYHHLPHTFGTSQDPEYAYLKSSGIKSLLKPFWVGLLLPILQVLRFGVLPLFSWLFPQSWKIGLYQKASTIVVNPFYLRPLPSAQELAQAQSEERLCALFFVVQLCLIYAGIIQLELIVAWYVMTSIGAFVNVWRARIAHRYDNAEGSLSPLAQLRDSVTVEKRFLAPLWAPAGMQYHSLHHLAPQVPYHNLFAAHQFLKANLDTNHPYSQTVVKDVTDGFKIFYKTVMFSK